MITSSGKSGKRSRLAATAAAGIAAAALALTTPSVAATTPSPGSTHFPRYKELEPNVAFWADVFSKWSSRQIAFHDVEHLELVYSVISVDDIVTRLPAGQQDDAIKARRKAEGERISSMLIRISEGHARTEEERRILKAIAKMGHEPSHAQNLSLQVRSQRGLGDKFCEAVQRAESYRPMMSAILASYDVPQELLALPLVESGYKIGAFSSAGASGIWQFMPATGRLYMEVGSAYDDRRDPRRSTEAAARMLRQTYENIGSWPLAITSYNHGPGGIARAVRDMGTTHFGVISRHYKGKSFGFASRNYYAEFLAAVDAMKRSEEICGQVVVQPYQPDEAKLSTSASARDLARAAGMSVERLAELNPAWSSSVARGSVKVPRGYRLNLPHGTRGEFAANFRSVDLSPAAPVMVAKESSKKSLEPIPTTGVTAKPPGTVAARPAVVVAAKPAAPTTHKVKRGETLGEIARHYGTTETTLMYMNRLRDRGSIQIGQSLKIPNDRATAPSAVAGAKVEKIERPPFSRTMTTNAGLIAAKEAGQAASAAALAARTAAVVVPAAVIENQEAAEAVATADATAEAVPAAVITKDEPADTAEADAKQPETAEAAAAATPTAAEPAAQQEKEEPEQETVLTAEHKVGRGQTLTQIASMYHTSVTDLKQRNGITDEKSIQAGQVLKVRTTGSEIVSASTVGRTYKVRSGDTLWSVARANDTSVETLKRLNPRLGSKGSGNLKAGEAIKVPAAGAVAAAPARKDPAAGPAATASAKKPAVRTASVKSTAKAPAKATAKKNSYRSHRVQKGQTLSSIAKKYSTSVDTLKRINGIRDASNVQVGKTLKVPL